MSVRNTLMGGSDWQNGNVLDANDLVDTFHSLCPSQTQLTALSLPPIGSIIPWHRDLNTNTVTIFDGWEPCNGQVLDDEESPYHGKTLPPLNGIQINECRFIRGSTTSGSLQGQTQPHSHSTNVPNNNPSTTNRFQVKVSVTSTTALPPYMNIIWVIRVK